MKTSDARSSAISILITLIFIVSFMAAVLPQVISPKPVYAYDPSLIAYTANGSWTAPAGVTSITVLVVGGGGGGAGAGGIPINDGGGGGAGGLIFNASYPVTPGNSYTVTVGPGGPYGNGNASGTTGGNSVFDTLTAKGGGGGGCYNANGKGGGSGGGGSGASSSGYATAGGSGTSGQGNTGGKGYKGSEGAGGGGGGNTSVGSDGTCPGGLGKGGNGGSGGDYHWTFGTTYGQSGVFAGGGGGAGYQTKGTGGSGGGGDGATNNNNGNDATVANSGSGGGGAANPSSGTKHGGNGAAGIVILKWYWVNTTAGSGGTIVTPSVVSAGYAVNATIYIYAVPNACYTFNGWTGDTAGLNSTATASAYWSTLTSNRSVTANFVAITGTPTVTTQSPTGISKTGATGNGNITSIGCDTVTRRGFCYKAGTSGDPTTSDSVAYDDGSFSTGAYTKAISGLTAGTGYRVRAYAVNSYGTSYGSTVQMYTTSDWGQTDYQYRKSLTIPHTDDGALTNYQIKISIVKGSGSDSGCTVYLNNSALNWPSDVRFTKADGTTLLDFWREEYDSTDGTWWVEFDSIPAHPDDGQFYLYYGNASAADASNGGNTFTFFDDFNDNSINSSAWTTVNSGSGNYVNESNQEIQIHTNGSKRVYLRSLSSLSAPYILDCKAKKSENIEINIHWDGIANGSEAQAYNAYWAPGYRSWLPSDILWIREFTNGASSDQDTYSITLDNNYHNYETVAKTSGINISYDGTWVLDTTDTTRTSGYLGFSSREQPNAVNAYYDDVRIRQYTANQPSCGTWGSVENLLPTVTTQAPTGISKTGATGNGNITAAGSFTITRRGFCYKSGTSGDPTTTDSTAYDDGSFSTGAYTKAISGLSAGTGYRVRAYAVNSYGTSYGSTVQMYTTANWGQTDYQYRKSLTIPHTDDGALTNYQMKISIINGSGSDSSCTVYLNNSALNWPSDIRFTKADGTTLLDFWREEYDATDGTWWVEFDSIPAHPDEGQFYIYYGYASATDASNGSNTFLFFDDFSGTLGKWDSCQVNNHDTSYSCDASVESGELHFETTGCMAYLPNNASVWAGSTDTITEVKAKPISATSNIFDIGIWSRAVSDFYAGGFCQWESANTSVTWKYVSPTATQLSSVAFTITAGTWYKWKFIVGGTIQKFYVDDVLKNDTSDTAVSGSGRTAISQDSYNQTGGSGDNIHSHYDDFRVRQYTANEPSCGTWGSVENRPNAPTIGTVSLWTTGGSPTETTSMSPQVEYNIKIPVTDSDTLNDLVTVNATLYYDSDGTYSEGEVPTSGNTQTCAILTWTKATNTLTISSGAGSSWAVNNSSSVFPSLSGTSGTFELHFTPGKVATYTTGAAKWHIYAKATDSISLTGTGTKQNLTMNWYGEIAVNTGSVNWGSISPGTDFGESTKQTGISVTYVSNGAYAEQVSGSGTWTGAPSGTATLNSGGSPSANQFSLKADDTATLGSAVLVNVSPSYTTVDNTGTITGESGDSVTTNTLWLKLGTPFTTANYSGTIYWQIAQP